MPRRRQVRSLTTSYSANEIYRKADNIAKRLVMEWDEELIDSIAEELSKKQARGEDIRGDEA